MWTTYENKWNWCTWWLSHISYLWFSYVFPLSFKCFSHTWAQVLCPHRSWTRCHLGALAPGTAHWSRNNANCKDKLQNPLIKYWSRINHTLRLSWHSVGLIITRSSAILGWVKPSVQRDNYMMHSEELLLLCLLLFLCFFVSVIDTCSVRPRPVHHNWPLHWCGHPPHTGKDHLEKAKEQRLLWPGHWFNAFKDQHSESVYSRMTWHWRANHYDLPLMVFGPQTICWVVGVDCMACKTYASFQASDCTMRGVLDWMQCLAIRKDIVSAQIKKTNVAIRCREFLPLISKPLHNA